MSLDMTITAALKRDSIKREPRSLSTQLTRKENQVGDAVRAEESWRLDIVAIHEIKKLATDKAIRHGNDMKKTISTDFKDNLFRKRVCLTLG